MDRRRLLTTLGAGGAVIAATGLLDACTSGGSDGTGEDSPTSAAPSAVSTPDPRTAAAAVELTLHDEAVAVLAAHPDLVATVGPVRDAHAAHLVALVGERPPAGPETASSPDASITTPTPSVSTTGTASAALLGLASRERSAARLHATSASRASVDGSDARLVASLSAYSAAQDLVLTQAAR